MALELLDTRKNWARIGSNTASPFWTSIAPLPKLRAAPGIAASTSESLRDGTKTVAMGAFSGKTYSERKKK